MVTKEYIHYLDMHCHYENIQFQNIKKEFQKKENISIVNSTCMQDYEIYREWQEKIPNLFFAYGLYPDNVLKKDYVKIKEELQKIEFEKALCIGEIGIDYKITNNLEKIKLQEKLFEKQLEIAKKFKKPVIVHTRGATKRALEILKSWEKIKVILHWFSADKQEIEEALSRKYYLTQRFAKPLIPEVRKYLGQLFMETDAPVMYNGKPTDIQSIREAYQVFSKKHEIDEIELRKKMMLNFKKLFPKIKIV